MYETREKLASRYGKKADELELSMGTTEDYEDAVDTCCIIK